MHRLKLAPGRHTLTVTCELCESAGRTVSVSVEPRKENLFLVPAPLKPSLVSFDGFPDDAVARIGAETRSIAEAKKNPFRITMPPEGSPQMRHQVKYEVTKDSERLGDGVVDVKPGDPLVITRGSR